MGARSERVTIRLPSRFLEAIDLLVGLDDFPSRSEAIRTAVRDLVYSRVSLVTKKAKRLRELHLNVSRLRELESQLLKR
ncbi:MAG: ribbon-helix-helix domain-containing protein [Thermoplasmata archaeon]